MKLYDNNLLGRDWANINLNYCGSDTEEAYNRRLKKMPENWYYRNKIINYSYNSSGHRCENISDIDLDNYILFVGGSHTEGIGLELETTFPYVISKKLNTSYYNLGLGNAGLDTSFYNLNIWLSNYNKPKYVVMTLTDPVRCATLKNNLLETQSIQSEKIEVKNLLFYGDYTGYFDARCLFIGNMLKSLFNYHKIPYSIISLEDIETPFIEYKFFPRQNTDRARDMTHSGIECHRQVSDYVVSDYTDKYMNATINSITRG